MRIGFSYEQEARNLVARLAQVRGKEHPTPFSSLVNERFALMLLGATDDGLDKRLEGHLASSDTHKLPYWVPEIGLEKAVAAALIGQPATPYLDAVADAWDAAADSVDLDRESRWVATWAMLAFAWAGERKRAKYWLERRRKLGVSRATADVPAIQFAHEALGDASSTLAGLEACLAYDTFRALSEDTLSVAAMLLAHAALRDEALPEVLSRQCVAIDADLWPDGPDGKPRVQDSEVVWMLRKKHLIARVQVTGDGEEVTAVEPFLTHAFDLAEGLDRFAGGESKPGDVDRAKSRKQITELLASSETRITLTFVQLGTARLAEDKLKRCDPILATIESWLARRHGERFRAKLTWETTTTPP